MAEETLINQKFAARGGTNASSCGAWHRQSFRQLESISTETWGDHLELRFLQNLETT